MKPNNEIPICLAYNQSHYEALVPNTKEDEKKTITLKKEILSGKYTKTMNDIAIFKKTNLKRKSSYAEVVKKGNINASEIKTKVIDDSETKRSRFYSSSKIDSLSKRFDEIRNIMPKDRTDNEKKEYNVLRVQISREKKKCTQEKELVLDKEQSEKEKRIEEIEKLRIKDRTDSQKKELNKLRNQVRREKAKSSQEFISKSCKKQNKIGSNEDADKSLPDDPIHAQKKELEIMDRIQEITKKKPKDRTDSEKKEYTKLRVQQSRLNSSKEKIQEIKAKERKAKETKKKSKRITFKRVAASIKQDNFLEENIPTDLLDSSIGSLYDKKNQCQYCKAYRFKKERNFCCSQGDIILPKIPEPPKELEKLYDNKAFTDNIRGYNNILAMASIGCNTPDNVKGPNFKIFGKVHHKIGSLLPSDGEDPKFLQLYFYDCDQATDLRLKIMPRLDATILKMLTRVLEENNSYVRSFKTALEYVSLDSEVSLCIIADKAKVPKGQHSGRYSLPQGSEVAAILPGEGEGELEVIVKDKENKLTKINRLHRSYDPLLYVTFDPYGTDGFSLGLKRINNPNRNVSIADFYGYRIQVRPGFNPLLRSKRCFQQYLVDQGAKIEGMRLNWVTSHQKKNKSRKIQWPY